MLPPDLFEDPINAFRDLLIVSALALVAILVARARYVSHRDAMFSKLSPERVARRKGFYEWMRWLGFIAVLCAFLRFCYAWD